MSVRKWSTSESFLFSIHVCFVDESARKKGLKTKNTDSIEKSKASKAT